MLAPVLEFDGCSKFSHLILLLIHVVEKCDGVLGVELEILEECFSFFDELAVGLRYKIKGFVELCLHFYIIDYMRITSVDLVTLYMKKNFTRSIVATEYEY